MGVASMRQLTVFADIQFDQFSEISDHRRESHDLVLTESQLPEISHTEKFLKNERNYDSPNSCEYLHSIKFHYPIPKSQ